MRILFVIFLILNFIPYIYEDEIDLPPGVSEISDQLTFVDSIKLNSALPLQNFILVSQLFFNCLSLIEPIYLKEIHWHDFNYSIISTIQIKAPPKFEV